jgi:hypothetical protein
MPHVTRKAINDALRARGRDESLYPGDGYFYFGGGDAVDWLSSSVMVKRISDLTLDQWLREFDSLLERNTKLQRQMSASRPRTKLTKPVAKSSSPQRKSKRKSSHG